MSAYNKVFAVLLLPACAHSRAPNLAPILFGRKPMLHPLESE